MSIQSNVIVDSLMKATGKNVSQLAAALTEYSGKTIHRQMIQNWRKGKGMNMANYNILLGYMKDMPQEKVGKKKK